MMTDFSLMSSLIQFYGILKYIAISSAFSQESCLIQRKEQGSGTPIRKPSPVITKK
jgi:hypothetical protein